MHGFDLIEVLRDNIWEFILGLAALLLIPLFRIVDLRREKRGERKELSYYCLCQRDEPVAVGDDNSLVATHRFGITLINTGQLPIEPSHYERPVVFYVPQSSQILDATITDTNPTNVHPKMVRYGNRVELSPILLNPGNSITFEVWSTSAWFNYVYADGRVTGVDKIRDITTPTIGRYSTSIGLLTVGVLSVLVGILLSSGRFEWLYPRSQKHGFVGICFGIAVLGIVLLTPKLRKALTGNVAKYFGESVRPR